MQDTSTIVVSKKLKRELDSFKDFERETYQDVIQKLVIRARETDESRLELSAATRKSIARAREDIAKGRVYTSEQVRKNLGFKQVI